MISVECTASLPPPLVLCHSHERRGNVCLIRRDGLLTDAQACNHLARAAHGHAHLYRVYVAYCRWPPATVRVALQRLPRHRADCRHIDDEATLAAQI